MSGTHLESHLQKQTERSQDFFWHRLRWDAVDRYLPKETEFELVDVGAGAGILGKFLQRDHPTARYRWVEPIPSLRNQLERTFGSGSDANGRDTYSEASFVTLLDVLEHQEDDKEFMRSLVGRLAPGATLLVTVPALPVLWSGWDVALGHYRRYRKRTLRDSVAGLPVEFVEVSYLFPEMVPASLVRKLARPVAESEEDVADAELPDLPKPANELIYSIGTVSLKLRRIWPIGTSLFAVLRRA